jgi:hypothetical protein
LIRPAESESEGEAARLRRHMDKVETERPPRPARGGKMGIRIGGEPADEIDHFYRCPYSSQMVDRRDLQAVIHHDRADRLKRDLRL